MANGSIDYKLGQIDESLKGIREDIQEIKKFQASYDERLSGIESWQLKITSIWGVATFMFFMFYDEIRSTVLSVFTRK